MKTLTTITFVLVLVGALNWGLVAIGFNLVSALFGGWPLLERAIYLLVGLSAIVQLINFRKA